mmetsp:Transcript_113121/g.196430  ORF Transcript_113121/g.196430 Transcript_113121/m.196430 type:complete len:86 (-) Transcript_113121:822-1079(-)
MRSSQNTCTMLRLVTLLGWPLQLSASTLGINIWWALALGPPTTMDHMTTMDMEMIMVMHTTRPKVPMMQRIFHNPRSKGQPHNVF